MAIKIDDTAGKQIRIESMVYARLGAITLDSLKENDACIPSVYYFKFDHQIGDMKVDIMVMQRLGRSISRHVFDKDKFSIREMLIAGTTLVTVDYI